VGFKNPYNLENSQGCKNYGNIEHQYNVMKWKIEVIKNKEIIFKEDKL